MQITDFVNNPQPTSSPKSISAFLEIITASAIFFLPLLALFIFAAK